MRRLCTILVLLGGCAGYGSAFSGSARIAEVRCEQAFTCRSAYPSEPAASHEARYGTNQQACAERLGPDPARQDAWDAAEEAGELTYDKDAAKACVSALQGLACDTFWADPEPAACQDALQGTLPLDAGCDIDAVCSSGLCQEGRCAGNAE